MPAFESRTLTITIQAPAERIYAFVSDPRNLPRWAAGLARSVSEEDGLWRVETADGPVGVRFVEQNPFGVLDHHVTFPSGEEVVVPMRVIANGPGADVIFTVFRTAAMSEQQLAADAAMVGRDLLTLKELLELEAAPGSS